MAIGHGLTKKKGALPQMSASLIKEHDDKLDNSWGILTQNHMRTLRKMRHVANRWSMRSV